jgi:hypothetical protein
MYPPHAAQRRVRGTRRIRLSARELVARFGSFPDRGHMRVALARPVGLGIKFSIRLQQQHKIP